MKDICWVYIIKSKLFPNKSYVGATKNIKKRWFNHKNKLKNNCHENDKIQEHYNLYGESDLIYEILCECDSGALTNKEQYYMDIINPTFNNVLIAGSRLGCKMPIEFGEKMSKSHKGKSNYWLKGKSPSEEIRQKMSLAHIGIKHTKQDIIKMRENSPLNKEVIDLETGIVFMSISEAARSRNVSPAVLRAYLNGARRNKTSLRIIDNLINN
jgi:group I intron endonuclease